MAKVGLAVLLVIFVGTAVMAGFLSYNLVATSSPPFRQYPAPFKRYVGSPLGEVPVNQTAIASLSVENDQVNGTSSGGVTMFVPFNWTLNLTVYNEEPFNLTIEFSRSSTEYVVPANSSELISLPSLEVGNYSLYITGTNLEYQAYVDVVPGLVSPYVFIGE
ncbi:sulfocyanin [Sulfodiicoccus acidiphilus]|uniref:Sulfocyanin n=1 Tax=Sulfodiicoccus acidiphilus TaxID=1670455 RepID=A0A348B499_9CREN|nr:sulfocyanin-like copper-binding protein [Sulfodiicoccus acidiphilus]BBD73001.1 sulfocyanin [Sulfodiicoccus acidiphilus]GGU04593.1 sulfocyanin [Sulfodiicoccus acidiphilus]